MRKEEAKKWLSNRGYGSGTNLTIDTVAHLLIDFASQSKPQEIEWISSEIKPESDDVKAGGIDRTPRYVRAFNPSHHEVEDVYFTGGTCDENEFIMQGAGGYFFTIGAFSEIEPTLEQKARKKAEEMYYKIESSQEAIYQALLIDPKTL